MAVGDPGKVRYPIYPRSEKPGLYMQPRGAGVTFKMLAWSLSTYINKDGGWKTLCDCKRDFLFTGIFPVMWAKFNPFS